MRIIRKARRYRRAARRFGIAAILAAALGLGACGVQNGLILEMETGRNGVKAEVKDGAGDYEVYLVPDTTCAVDQYIQDCADKDDYLVSPPGHTTSRDTDD